MLSIFFLSLVCLFPIGRSEWTLVPRRSSSFSLSHHLMQMEQPTWFNGSQKDHMVSCGVGVQELWAAFNTHKHKQNGRLKRRYRPSVKDSAKEGAGRDNAGETWSVWFEGQHQQQEKRFYRNSINVNTFAHFAYISDNANKYMMQLDYP